MVVLWVLRQEPKFYGLDDGDPAEPELDADGFTALESYRQRRS
jgi:hypothetical protein